MLALKTYRTQIAGFSDLLNWAAVIDDGIVLQKDGSLLAAWHYRGDDVNGATPAELNALSARVNREFGRLGSGWMIHVDAVRMPSRAYPDPSMSAFPDPVSRAIDEERRRQYEEEGRHYETTYVIALTYMPPLRQQNKIVDLVLEDDTRKTGRAAQGERIVQQFKRAIEEFEEGLENAIRLRRLKGKRHVDEWGKEHVADELLQYLGGTLDLNFHPVNLPPCPMYLDAILGAQDFTTGIQPRIGDQYITVVAIDGFPMESHPGILSMLDHLPLKYRWNTRFIFLDSVESIGHLKRYRRKWQQKVRGFFEQLFQTGKGMVNEDALMMVRETESAIAEASSGMVTYGYLTSNIILMHEDPDTLEETGRFVRQQIRRLGFSARIETVNAVEAWLGTLPGQSAPNVRQPLMHTLHLLDFIPLSGVWPGHEYCPCPLFPENSPPLLHCATDGSTPFRLNLHVGDVGHTFVGGPTGAGKSVLMGMIAAQFLRYPNARVYCLEKGRSMTVLTQALGGQHYELGDEGELQFCPLQYVTNDLEQSWAEDWISNLLLLQNIPVDATRNRHIHEAMKKIRARGDNGRSLEDFVADIQDPDEKVRDALQFYATGQMSYLLNGERDGLAESNFLTFELGELMSLPPHCVLPVLLYLFRQIERQMTGDPTLIILDEAWLMLQHDVFRDRIIEWLKTLRKANASVVMSTQSISDATRSGILDIIAESCPTRIFLPNPSAFEHASYEMYKTMGLNDRQIDIIRNAIPKQEYYYISPEGRRLFNLNLGPLALALAASTSIEDSTRARQLKAEHGDAWLIHFLTEKGVSNAIIENI